MLICSKSHKGKKLQYTFAANFPFMVFGEIQMFLSQLWEELNTALLILKDVWIIYFAAWTQQCPVHFSRTALLSRQYLGLQYVGCLVWLVIEVLEANT